MTVPFAKMHGIGNDFILFDRITTPSISIESIQHNVKHLCDRHFGIGSDGVLVVESSQEFGVDFTYRMFNPDGSEAEMCGNGIRCFGKWVFEQGHTNNRNFTVMTKAGLLTLELTGAGTVVEGIVVDMGEPRLSREDIPMTGPSGIAVHEPLVVDSQNVSITAVSMGNPHAVYFVKEVQDDSINRIGPNLEKHPRFPHKTNVHEVHIASENHLHMLTWERGAGRTLACGTGACAVAVASHLNQLTGRSVQVTLAGGDLDIFWDPTNNHVYMTGPADLVCTGHIFLT